MLNEIGVTAFETALWLGGLPLTAMDVTTPIWVAGLYLAVFLAWGMAMTECGGFQPPCLRTPFS